MSPRARATTVDNGRPVAPASGALVGKLAADVVFYAIAVPANRLWRRIARIRRSRDGTPAG